MVPCASRRLSSHNRIGTDLRVQIPQALDDLHRECSVQRLFLKFAKSRCRVDLLPATGAEQPVRQQVRFLAREPATDHDFSHPAEIFHQHHAQRNGQRPQLADGERLQLLIGLTKRRKSSGSNRLSVCATYAHATPNMRGNPSR